MTQFGSRGWRCRSQKFIDEELNNLIYEEDGAINELTKDRLRGDRHLLLKLNGSRLTTKERTERRNEAGDETDSVPSIELTLNFVQMLLGNRESAPELIYLVGEIF